MFEAFTIREILTMVIKAKKKSRTKGVTMLCFRCEHRARFLETGSRPRYECGEIETSKSICYMFTPVKPVVLTKFNKDDPRPILDSPMISARVLAERLADFELTAEVDGEEVTPYWKPK